LARCEQSYAGCDYTKMAIFRPRHEPLLVSRSSGHTSTCTNLKKSRLPEACPRRHENKTPMQQASREPVIHCRMSPREFRTSLQASRSLTSPRPSPQARCLVSADGTRGQMPVHAQTLNPEPKTNQPTNQTNNRTTKQPNNQTTKQPNNQPVVTEGLSVALVGLACGASPMLF
jgi:hypothetical protein